MPISAHPLDMYVWYDASLNIVKNGPMSVHFFPPIQGYFLLVPLAYFYNWLAHFFSLGSFGPVPMDSIPSVLNFYPNLNALYMPGMLFNFVVKLPLLFSDVFATLLLYKTMLSLTSNKKLAEKAAIFWFLNPYLILISSIWGMWDTLPALFSLSCLYFLFKKKFVLSSICLTVGFFLKLYPILFLVPIGIYILKSSSVKDKSKNFLKFFSVFSIASVLLSLPLIDRMTRFFTDFIAPNPATIGSITNPISNPIAFGLTYWSLYSLNRLINLPLTIMFASFASIASIILVVVALILVYWKVGKMSFQKPAYDLALCLLLPILALFLSFRILCEQWFVWALPFLVILCVGGKVKGFLFWGASILGILYAVLNCPLPFFFLPMERWIGNSLVSSANFLLSFEPIRIGLLATIGCLFSLFLFLIMLDFRKQSKIEGTSAD
jgi:hypothetical protein